VVGYLYVLESRSSGAHYVGSAVNPDRRLYEHRIGHVAATAGRGPWERVALVEFPTLRLARQAEMWIKRLRRKELVRLVVAGRFAWPERFGVAKST
jgi:predicted GIY-YIG superfamily endonuclease